MKNQVDKHRGEIEFQEGDWELVKLKPCRQFTLAHQPNNKLSKRYFGSFQIKKKINSVAYLLNLPVGSRIHHTFHIDKLKKF